jgi:thioredoxin-related protein
MNYSRRQFGVWAAASGAALITANSPLLAASDSDGPVLKEDGQYTQPWFLESFLELPDDLEEARAAGKRLAIIWEQEGCPYCRETHLVNFAIPEIRDYIRANFEILQMDIWGARAVVDFDGKSLEEKALAKRGAVRFTPTIQFFPESLETVAGRGGRSAEIARMPGYFRPFHFLTMFQYVQEKGYESGDFRSYLKAKTASYAAQGKQIPSW